LFAEGRRALKAVKAYRFKQSGQNVQILLARRSLNVIIIFLFKLPYIGRRYPGAEHRWSVVAYRKK
jgi:hypothetical protein